MQSGVDAQCETERDIDRGLAGAEAKPFANSPPTDDAKTKAPDAKDDARPLDGDGEHNDDNDQGNESLISGRRNPGRE
ncbi:hypothetical protein [Novosphingobium sp. P6W]|uniref:hypothetical protein n=1 Tax=Novosphingobium sp. P6W TaxID=1609758 RepID=UPI0005C2E40F|nr:hypothetical protein [Novosphingobium sp. P6W]KIS30714.1 hypothetical protein TQ38_20900 [Novosphingobium sp. P6W]